MASSEELRQEAEWRRCRGSGPTDWKACLYFLEHYWHIRHPERGRMLFPLREAQTETLESWLTERYSIVLKARQIGYSTLASSIAFWISFFHTDKYIIFLSRGEREAASLLRKAKYGYKHLADWMKVRGPSCIQNTLSLLSFSNDSSIVSLPSTQDPARGESAYLIVVDEWAFLENPDEAWASIEPVADVGGRVIGLSTANGSGNFFHTFWQRAVEGGRFKPMFYPWSANTDRDDTWYEDKADDLRATPWILHQEYPRSPEEAFIKSGRTVFDSDFLDTLAVAMPHAGRLWAPNADSHFAEFWQEDKGELAVFEPPEPEGCYVIGADVAEGLEHGDFSSAHVIDVRGNRVVAVWHGHVAPDQFGLVLARLGWWYHGALVGVEVNNHGLTTCVELQRIRYANIYYRTQIDQRTNQQSRKLGWRTQQNTKPYLIDQLAKAMRDGLGVRDEPTIRELRLFVREPDGKQMHGSPYDDRTMSLGIAVEMMNFAFAPEYTQSSNTYGSLDWWASQLDDATPKADAAIGALSVRSKW